MKRREFLKTSAAGAGDSLWIDEASTSPETAQSVSAFSSNPMQRKRNLIRTTTGIEPYPGPWNAKVAAHLLRRTMFGPLRSEIAYQASRSLDDSLTKLFQDQPQPSPPVDPTTGQTWVNGAYDSTNDGRYNGYLKAWWVGLMVTPGMSIREKMVLFWHNHFPSEYVDVQDSRYIYRQNALFRQYALGNIKEFVKAVTLDPAMLVYLNGYRNRGDGNNIPDENYARELQELFTIGKGPEIAAGNYTEQDVKAAAHVLTGWRIRGFRDTQNATIESYPDPARHDTRDKVFSSAYQNTIITGGTDLARELTDLVEMIFRQEETAKFLCRKLYRWFVYYDIDPNVEQNVIVPLANVMRDNNYEVKPVLNALFRSAHFFDDNNVGCLIKNPIDLVVGGIRQLEIPMPDPVAQSSQYYSLMSSLRGMAATLQMNIMDPPNVAGWPAYYQIPDFNELWISTATLPARGGYTDSLVNGIRVSGTTFAANSADLAKTVSDPSNPRALIDELAQRFFPIDVTANQKDYLIGILIPGLPEYEWTVEWLDYTSHPNDQQKRKVVADRLNALLKFMMRMAEFQLA